MREGEGTSPRSQTAADITYSLSGAAKRLIQPSRLYRLQELREKPSYVPRLPGIYAWWFDNAVPDVPRSGSVECSGLALLYVGIAPSAPSASGRASKRTLYDRLKNHCRGPIASSTLRRTLTSLVKNELGLSLTRSTSGRLLMSRGYEDALSGWMNAHAQVSWMEDQEPWIMEDMLIASGLNLPLNIKGSENPFASDLKARRSLLYAGL